MEKENLNKISFQRKSLKKTLRVDKGYFPYWKSLKKNLGLSYSPKKTVGCRIAIKGDGLRKNLGFKRKSLKKNLGLSYSPKKTVGCL